MNQECSIQRNTITRYRSIYPISVITGVLNGENEFSTGVLG